MHTRPLGAIALLIGFFDGEPVISLDGDRQTVIDDGISQRVTLHKGSNIIRAAIINGLLRAFRARILVVGSRIKVFENRVDWLISLYRAIHARRGR